MSKYYKSNNLILCIYERMIELFIDNVVTKIWEPISKIYLKSYSESLKLDAEELFRIHSKNVMEYYQYTGVNMNMLASLGCPYRSRNGVLSGCSMCDYQSEQAKAQGSLKALREKNPQLYAKTIKTAFQNSRGTNSKANLFELVSGYDSFDGIEVPDEVYEEMYGDKKLFSERPFRYIVEGRASSITTEKLKKLKDKLGKKERVSIEFGVEIADEWLRNHWLNKDIKNEQIVNSINSIHEVGFRAQGDVLIGIPGLTEEWSKKIFSDTVFWLDDIGIDEIVALPLNRKEYTLQGFLYKELKENKKLLELGLAQYEHTGIIWLFTVVDALYSVLLERPSLAKKLNLAQLATNTNSITNEIAYNGSYECDCFNDIVSSLQSFQVNKDINIILDLRKSFEKDKCYKEYTKLIEKQKKAGSIIDTIKIVGLEVANILWPGEERIILKFENELSNRNIDML